MAPPYRFEAAAQTRTCQVALNLGEALHCNDIPLGMHAHVQWTAAVQANNQVHVVDFVLALAWPMREAFAVLTLSGKHVG